MIHIRREEIVLQTRNEIVRFIQMKMPDKLFPVVNNGSQVIFDNKVRRRLKKTYTFTSQETITKKHHISSFVSK